MNAKTKKRVMDLATQQKLCGLLPASSDFTIPFTPDIYKEIPDEFKPVFILKPYTSKELKELVSTTQELKDEALDIYAHTMIRKHITNWSNLINISTNEDIDYSTGPDGFLSLELYEMLPMSVKSSLMSRLSEISSGIRY